MLNDDVFGAGVPLPYQKLTLLHTFEFKPHHVIVISKLFFPNPNKWAA